MYIESFYKVFFYIYSNELKLFCEKSTVFTSSIEKLKRDVFRSHMNMVIKSEEGIPPSCYE